jgi:hypothetical protein
VTKISQLSSIGDTLAIDDQFLIRDVSDGSTPNKSVTVSGITRALADGSEAAPALAFAADKDTGIYRSGTNALAIATNGTGRLFVTDTGAVGVGNTNPQTLLSLASATGTASPTPTTLRIQTTSSAADWSTSLPWGRLDFFSSDTSNSGPKTHAAIDVTAAGAAGGVSNLSLKTNDASGNLNSVLTATYDGYVRLASGTGGIQFNGDTAAANALDDYEEGTWTPEITGGTTAGTATYSVQVGRYTKTGNRVAFSLTLNYTAFDGTGQVRISLPFASNNTTNALHAASFRVSGYTLSASNVLTGSIAANVSYIQLEEYPAGGGTLANAPVDAAANLVISGVYESA